jgi:hypothetical protein
MIWVSTFPYAKFYPELNYLAEEFGITRGNVIIGNDVWLGRDCKIMSGVTIGTGAVIATGAIVTQNVPPYAIFAGIPAKCIKFRFDDATIKSLLETKWWDWPDDEIRKIAPLICNENINLFIDYSKNRKR